VLILQQDGAASDAALTTAGLGLSKAPPFRAEVMPASRFTSAAGPGRRG
jgi:hypothetical protein